MQVEILQQLEDEVWKASDLTAGQKQQAVSFLHNYEFKEATGLCERYIGVCRDYRSQVREREKEPSYVANWKSVKQLLLFRGAMSLEEIRQATGLSPHACSTTLTKAVLASRINFDKSRNKYYVEEANGKEENAAV